MPRRRPDSCASALGLVSRVAVGDGHKTHLVPEGGVLGCDSSRLDIAVVRVRPDGDHADRFG